MSKDTKIGLPLMEKSKEMDSYYLVSLKKCFHVPQFHSTKFLIGIGEDAKEFKCNASVLAVISPVFRDTLLGKIKKGTPIKLPNISPVGFAALVRFAFSFDPEIGQDNVIEVIHAAKELEVTIIYELALKYLSTMLEGHFDVFFIPYIELATKYCLGEVVKKCLDSLVLMGGIRDFLKSKKFSEFAPEFVNLLLSRDELAVGESHVWDAVQAWAKVQSGKHKTDIKEELQKVYHNVRFPLMTTKDFSCHVVPTGVLTQKEMLDVFCYLTYPEGKPTTEPFSSVPRLLWDNICIKRYSKCGGDWFHLEGYVDCIGVETDRKCQILAVGVFVGEGDTRCRIRLFKGQGGLRQLLEETGDINISAKEKLQEPFRVNLKGPVTLLPGEVYEIEIDQIGPVSWKLKDGKTSAIQTCNDIEIKFTWHKPKVDTETSLKKGNIPCIWVRVLSGQ